MWKPTTKNLILLCIIYVLTWGGYTVSLRILGYLRREVAVEFAVGIYSGMIVTTLLGGVFMVMPLLTGLGHRWVFLIAVLLILCEVATKASSSAVFEIFFVLFGLGWACLDVARMSYVARIGYDISHQLMINGDYGQALVFGITTSAYEIPIIAEHGYSQVASRRVVGEIEVNKTTLVCGGKHCTTGRHPNPFQYEKHSIEAQWTTYGFCIAFLVIAGIVCYFLGSVRESGEYEMKKFNKKDACRILLGPLSMFLDVKFILLIPLTFYRGFKYYAMWGLFHSAFIRCSLGSWRSTEALLVVYLTKVVFCPIFAFVYRFTGRHILFTAAFVIDVCLMFVMMFWEPTENDAFVIWILLVFWGIVDAIWHPNLQALFATQFHNKLEEACCIYRFIEHLPLCVIFILGRFSACQSTQVYILAALLFLGMLGYVLSEVIQRKSNTEIPFERSKELDEIPSTSTIF